MAVRHLLALMLPLVAVVPAARGVWFDLPSTGVKCVYEKLRSNVVVLADFVAFYGDHDDLNSTLAPSISVKVSSPDGKELHHKDKVTYGEFAFTTNVAGNYGVCFWVDGNRHSDGKNVTIGLQWKTGLATKDWDLIAKKEKVEGLELDLQKLEDAVESIHQNFISMMSREMQMRHVSDKTNARVAHYSIISLGFCISVSVLQLWYLRRYFQKKKLV